MKRNYKRARREGALQRLEINLVLAVKNTKVLHYGVESKERKAKDAKNIARIKAEIATLVSRIGYV